MSRIFLNQIDFLPTTKATWMKVRHSCPSSLPEVTWQHSTWAIAHIGKVREELEVDYVKLSETSSGYLWYMNITYDMIWYDICKLRSNFTTFSGENLSQETVPSCAGKILRSLLTSQNCCRDIGIFCTSKLLVDGFCCPKILEKTIRLQRSSHPPCQEFGITRQAINKITCSKSWSKSWIELDWCCM